MTNFSKPDLISTINVSMQLNLSGLLYSVSCVRSSCLQPARAHALRRSRPKFGHACAWLQVCKLPAPTYCPIAQQRGRTSTPKIPTLPALLTLCIANITTRLIPHLQSFRSAWHWAPLNLVPLHPSTSSSHRNPLQRSREQDGSNKRGQKPGSRQSHLGAHPHQRPGSDALWHRRQASCRIRGSTDSA